jgi:hypothetical protein
MKTYQYVAPQVGDEDDETIWIASTSQDYADQHALEEGWIECGGCIFDAEHTRDLLTSRNWGGIDIVIECRDYVRYFEHCGQAWTDRWSCACNDECPVCGGEIEPHDYDEDFDIKTREEA